MKINNLIAEELTPKEKSKLNRLKSAGYDVITAKNYNKDTTKFEYETVGTGADIVYLAKAKAAENNNNGGNNSNNNNNNSNNNNSNNNNHNNSNNQPPANTDLNDYIGKYKAENGEESEIMIDGAGLKANLQGIPFKFTKTSKDLFDVVGYGLSGRCEFLRDSSNKVIGLTAEIGGHSVKATKVGVSASAGSGGSSSVPAINPQASSGRISGSVSGWPTCVQTTQQKNIYIITDKKDIPVTYFKDQAGADDFLTKNTTKGYEIKKEACVFKFEDCDLDLQGPFSCEMYLRKNGTFISNGDYKIGQWKCSERNRVQYFDLQLSEEKIRKNIKKGLTKLIK